jgi:biopolymer transport protein ExbD
MFLISIAEVFRLLSFNSNQFEAPIIDYWQYLFFKFVVAFTSLLTGLGFTVNAIARAVIPKPRYVRLSIVNDFTGIQWLFNFWSFRTAYLMFSLAVMIHLWRYVSLFDYWYWFLLSLAVLLLNQWTRARLFLKGLSTYHLVYSSCAVTLLSVILAFLPFFDHKALDELLFTHTVGYNMMCDLPTSRSSTRIERHSHTIPIYVGFQHGADSISFMSGPSFEFIPKTGLRLFLHKAKEVNNRWPLQQYPYIVIYADRRVPLSDIKDLLWTLRLTNTRRVMFVTDINSNGISKVLTVPCQELADTVVPAWPCADLVEYFSGLNVLQILLVRNQIEIGGDKFHIDKFENRCRSHSMDNGPNASFTILADDSSHYEALIGVLDIINHEIDLLRNEEALRVFGEPFSRESMWTNRKLYDHCTEKYPEVVHIWSNPELEYIQQHMR